MAPLRKQNRTRIALRFLATYTQNLCFYIDSSAVSIGYRRCLALLSFGADDWKLMLKTIDS